MHRLLNIFRKRKTNAWGKPLDEIPRDGIPYKRTKLINEHPDGGFSSEHVNQGLGVKPQEPVDER